MFKIFKNSFFLSLVVVLVLLNFNGATKLFVFNGAEKNISKEVIDPYTAESFASKVYDEADTNGNVDITLDRDIDLSDFSSSTFTEDTQDNEFAIHDLNNVTIDFNGYTAYNKTYDFLSSDTFVSPNSYEAAVELYYPDEWSEVDGLADNVSFYYIYWFYDIENLTIKNANIKNVPFLAYDIDNLTIEDSIFSNTELSGIYFARYQATWSTTVRGTFKHNVGLVADQVANLYLTNVLFNDYTIKQNIFNYSRPPANPDFASREAVGNIGLFTRIGFDSSSTIEVKNVAFENIDISLNERGLSDNPDGQMNYGIFVSIKGQSNFSDVYFNEISFFNNNDLNSNGTRQNGLILMVSDYASDDPDASNSIVNLDNIFVGNVFTTVPSSTLVAGNAFEYNQFQLPSTSAITPKALDENVVGYSNVTFTSYSEEQKDEILESKGYSETLISFNSFVDAPFISSASIEEVSSNRYFESNFDSDYYVNNNDSIPTPIDSVIVSDISQSNLWRDLKVTLKLKSGFHQYKSELLTVAIDNKTTGEVAYTETFEYSDQSEYEINYSKPSGERLNRYSVSVYSSTTNTFLLNGFNLEKAVFPIWIIIVIILLFIIIALIILLLALLFLKRKVDNGIALASEANELAIQMYDYQYDFNNIDAYYEYLNLSKATTLKKAQKVQNRNIIEYQKEIISKEEFDNRQVSIAAIIEYIERGGDQ